MSARVVFGFFLGISSIAVPALAIDAGADLGGASIGGRAAVGSGGASAGVGPSVDWVGEAEDGGPVGSGESDSSSPSIGGGATLNTMALRQARVQASTGSAELRPAARWEAVPYRVAKNNGGGASSSSGKGGTASGSQGKGKSGAKSNSGKGGTVSGSQGKGKSGAKSNSGKGGTVSGFGTKGVLGGALVIPNGPAQDMGRPHTVSLPLILRPSRGSGGEATPPTLDDSLRWEQRFDLRPVTPEVIVRACREAIVAAAVPHGAVSVSAASAGRLGRAGDALVAPISVSIEYLRQGGIERRQARVNCVLTEERAVVALQ